MTPLTDSNLILRALIIAGLIGFGFFLLILVPVLGQLTRAIAGAKGTLAVGFACGLVALMLHGLIDFNFHIPSNALVGAALAGTLLGLPWKHAS